MPSIRVPPQSEDRGTVHTVDAKQLFFDKESTDARVGDYVVFSDDSGNRYTIDGMTLAALSPKYR